MAAPKKKQTAKRGSTQKRTSAPAAAKKVPRRREIGAITCLFLGVISLFGCFNISAVFLDFFNVLGRGLLGWGYFAMPAALLVCAYILGFHRGKPVVLRVTCDILIPVGLGCLLHLALSGSQFTLESSMISKLWTAGKVLQSGGVICGSIAVVLKALLSSVVSVIIYVLGLIFLVLAVLDLSLSDIVDWVKSKERVEYEEVPEPVEPGAKPRKKARDNAADINKMIDIPVDENTEATTVLPHVNDRKIEFKKPNVRTPDKFYDKNGKEIKSDVDMPEFLKDFEVPTVDGPISDLGTSKPGVTVTEQSISSVAEPEKIRPEEVAAESAAITKTLEEQKTQPAPEYIFPPLKLLKNTKSSSVGGKEEVASNAHRLSAALESFGIDARITDYSRGPSVTRYELELEAGVKLNKLTNLADDLALSLGASGVRIAPIPDKISTVGIEVPNKLVSVVTLREVIESARFQDASSKLSFALGKDISGSAIVGNIAKLPHLLIAGTTGSGKSVCMNSLILSVLYKARPDEVKFIMIDPKMVEFGVYNGIPHLLIPVVTDPKKAAGALQWAVTEMLRRYQKFSKTGMRDLASYNKYADASEDEEDEVMPQIVVVIDELADLMLVASKEVEESICRVAQMGRASGMHLVIATQRPSADVITGLMKANIPSRIALSVSSSLESRIILDTQGAEKLVGNGDMLYSPIGMNKPKRVQGTYVSDGEREKVIEYLKQDSEADYSEEITQAIEAAAIEKSSGSSGSQEMQDESDYDALFSEAAQVVIDLGQASVSMLQRKLKLGYSRAARLMDQMEEAEIVGPFEGSKPRSVLLTKQQWYQRQGGGEDPADVPDFDMDNSYDQSERIED